MKKLQISLEHRTLIESVIRESTKFRGNEELLDIFCDAVYKKSYLLMDTIRDEKRLKRHLMMICDSCMELVIKEKRKFEQTKIYRQIEQNDRLKESIVNIKKTPLNEQEELEDEFKMHQTRESIINLKEEIQRSEKYASTDMLIDPLEYCTQKRISEHTLDKLVHVIKALSSQYPKKRYYEIFSLRYFKKFNQAEIAKHMKISQVELSKRFVELVKLARENVN